MVLGNQKTNLIGLQERTYSIMINNNTLLSLIADLVQELLDTGADQNDIIWMLSQYGFSDKFIKDNYGLPFDSDKDGNE